MTEFERDCYEIRKLILEIAYRDAQQARREAAFFGLIVGVSTVALVSLVALAVLAVTA